MSTLREFLGSKLGLAVCRVLAALGAEDNLYKHVTTGRKARFDDGHEERHPVVKTADPDRIYNLVNWILSLR